MSRIIVFACIFSTALLLLGQLAGCSKDSKEVTLHLNALILPGMTDTQHEVVAKFSWHGGGYLQSISEVKVDHYDNSITIQPFGLLMLGGLCTMDIFERIDTVSLGVLAEGIYTVVLIGRNFAYYDTIYVPGEVSDTNFQFHITAVDLSTHQPVANIPVELWIDDTAFTRLTDTTNMSGTATIIFPHNIADTLTYHMSTGLNLAPGYYGQTQAIKGIPEVITIGIGE